MVAYSFQARFAPPIEAETKLHTLRNPRKRHARPGEELQLYQGMRTRSCRLIAEKTCTQVLGVLLRIRTGDVFLFEIGELFPGIPTPMGGLHPIEDREAFALADGFADFKTMARWWQLTYKIATWEGVLIGWGAPYLPAPMAMATAHDVAAPADAPQPEWTIEPFAWRPWEIADRIRVGQWRVVSGRQYQSMADRRVLKDGQAETYRIAGTCLPGLDDDFDGLEAIADVLLRLDRAAMADRDWAA